ncbi:DUF5723 family protein [Hymenobacter jejuensis]|uniref:DUF5723 domain-containing protein n=1 Tax=Hymenobacter jejuensis TaxID=2502781 RepID=A0A5B7ZZ15_9BACT|nr:DUF5723 family protein [Hymenobacter jejuensis]QDA60454.1 hypothetical protein FHG12_10185 [Hymenobacter jejuensis]
MRILPTCGLALALLPGSAAAQQLFNISRSNYSGLTAAAWNPATIADNRYALQIQLFAVDGHATNTAYRYTGPWSLRHLNEPLDLSSQYLTRNDSDKAKLFSAGLNVRGPGVLIGLGPKQSLAVSTRVRAAFQGNNVSPETIQNAVDEFKIGNRVQGNSFNLNMNAFAEWDATYGRVMLDDGLHFLKAGVTLKRLMGIGSGYLQGKNIDFEVSKKQAATGDTIVRIYNLDGAFAYSNTQAFEDVDVEKATKWLTPRNAPGSGWGVDLGIVYEYRPDAAQYQHTDTHGVDQADRGRNKYLYRASISVTDIGSIRYRDNAVVYNAVRARNVGVSEADLGNLSGDNFDEKINRILRTNALTRQNHFRVGLPTALNVDVDYHLSNKIYANLALSQGLRTHYATGMRQFSYVALTPRFETRWLEVAVPFSMTNSYQTFTYGAMVRIGPLVVGSNNLSALFDSSDPYGANAYAELSVLAWAHKKYKNKPAKGPKPPKTAKSS